MPANLTPNDLKEWTPINPRTFDSRNLDWVEDKRFEQLGEYLGQKIMKHVSNKIGWANPKLPDMKTSLHKRVQDPIAYRAAPFYLRDPPKKPRNNPHYKRLIQFSPINYHANRCQFYFEVYFEGANAYDSDDEYSRQKPKIAPPVGKDEIVIFLGIYASNEQMTAWATEIKDCDEYDALAHFDHMNELIQVLSEINVSRFVESEPFVVISENVSRYRIQLIRQSLNSEQWNTDLDLVMEEIMPIILKSFTEIGNLQITS